MDRSGAEGKPTSSDAAALGCQQGQGERRGQPDPGGREWRRIGGKKLKGRKENRRDRKWQLTKRKEV